MLRPAQLLALAVVLSWSSRAFPADDAEAAFRKQKPALLRELYSPKRDVRTAAVKKFEAFSTLEAAKTLLEQAQRNPDLEVRRACLKVLPAFADTKGVAGWLQTDFLRSWKADKLDELDQVRLGVLLAARDQEAGSMAQAVLTEIGKAPVGVVYLVGLVDRAAESADDPEVQRLILNVALNSGGIQHHGARRAITQALLKIKSKEALDAVMEMFPVASGEARAEIVARFVDLSGGKLALTTDWPRWWKENRETFEFAANNEHTADVALGGAAGPTYYGLPLYGSRIVFIIDISGSMTGARLDTAKAELVKAIGGLQPGVQFNVLAFNSSVIPWQKQTLVPVSNESKESAARFVSGLVPASSTASYDALEAALLCNGDAIYFLTDGAPYGGKTSNTEEIVTLISQANRVCRATIYSVGIGAGHGEFLQKLSDKNFGKYREVR